MGHCSLLTLVAVLCLGGDCRTCQGLSSSGAGGLVSLTPLGGSPGRWLKLSICSSQFSPGSGSSPLTCRLVTTVLSVSLRRQETHMISARGLGLRLSRFQAPGWLLGPENQRKGLRSLHLAPPLLLILLEGKTELKGAVLVK